MKQLKLPYKSHLTPMIHVFKNSSGQITKQVICYNPQGMSIAGRANHKYDPIGCGWQQPLAFMYIGPVLCCRRCHRHIWSEESYDRCPQCARPLKAQSQGAIHHPVSRGRIPRGGQLVSTYAEGR
jgi:hypothetical protein